MDPTQIPNPSFLPAWAPPPPAAAAVVPAPGGPSLPVAGPRPIWKHHKKRKPLPAGAAGGGGYNPPSIGDLQQQNRAKARRWFHPKPQQSQQLPPQHPQNRRGYARFAAPRNTTSFLIRAKRAGGIASLVSPCPVTPAILPTPRLSPSREGLVDMAHAEWGVDGYGSMKGRIRLRAQQVIGIDGDGGEGDGDDSGSSESEVEEHVEVERRISHDLSRFEMVYPEGEDGYGEEEESHVARLEEENLTLKERLFLMEREMGELRRRLVRLEEHVFPKAGVEEEGSENEGTREESLDKDGKMAGGDEGENAAAVAAVAGADEMLSGKPDEDEAEEAEEEEEGRKEEGQDDLTGENNRSPNGIRGAGDGSRSPKNIDCPIPMQD